MKHLIILLTITPLFIFAQNILTEFKSCGIGIIAMTSNQSLKDTLKLYSDSTCKDLIYNNIPSFDDTILSPFYFKPDYGLVHFILQEKYSNCYKILYRDTLTAFCKKDKSVKFITWEALLLNSTGFSFIDNKGNTVRKEPNEKSIALNWNNKTFTKDNFKIVKVKGDWIFVKNKMTNQSGWVIWRKQNKLLIEIYLLD